MHIQKPIFIIGAPRSGTTWIGEIMKQHPDIKLLHEISNIWMWKNAYKTDDVLTESDLNPKTKTYIQQKFFSYLQNTQKKRICDKTPRNCLRIRAIKEVFPDAKIIMVLRDGRAIINSTKKELNQPKGIPRKEIFRRLKNLSLTEIAVFLPRLGSRLKRIVGIPLDYWGARPPGWQKWVGKFPPHIVLAKQWSATMELAISEGRKLPSENYLEINYENLVKAPEAGLLKIANFIELENPQPVINFAVSTADPSRTDKWKDTFDDQLLEEIKEIMEPTMIKLGYQW